MPVFRRISLLLPVLFLSIPSAGQFFEEALSSEALRPFWDINGFGSARFSLHNNSLLSTDISATQFNPAFLTNIQRAKVNLSINYQDNHQTSTLADNNPDLKTNSGGLFTNHIGFAYPVPVYQGNLVLAFSYAPSAYYYSNLKSSGLFDLSEGTVTENINIEESGKLNTMHFAGAVEFMPNFNLGLSLNFHNGDRNYYATMLENEDQLDTGTEDFPNISYTESIKPSYEGFNMDLGFSYQSARVKFGLRFSTPVSMTIHEVSQFMESYTYQTTADWDTIRTYNFEYKSRYPAEVAPSFAVTAFGVTFGMDLVVHSWQDIEVNWLDDDELINNDLYWNLRRTTDIGLSLAMPLGKTISTRLAYRRIPSPYENFQEKEKINHLVGASIETILAKSVILGGSFQRAMGEQVVSHPYFGSYSTRSFNNNLFTLSIAVLL